MKCRTLAAKIDHHATRDGVFVSDGAANASRVGLFPPGMKSICKCKAEGSDPAACDALYILDQDGEHFATFHGSQYRAAMNDDASLCVYRQPGASKTQDAGTSHSELLARLNRQNREFYGGSSKTQDTQAGRRAFPIDCLPVL